VPQLPTQSGFYEKTLPKTTKMPLPLPKGESILKNPFGKHKFQKQRRPTCFVARWNSKGIFLDRFEIAVANGK
jgi:hypothetical protein